MQRRGLVVYDWPAISIGKEFIEARTTTIDGSVGILQQNCRLIGFGAGSIGGRPTGISDNGFFIGLRRVILGSREGIVGEEEAVGHDDMGIGSAKNDGDAGGGQKILHLGTKGPQSSADTRLERIIKRDMQTQLKVPFNTVRNRAGNIQTTMLELAPVWLAPGFVTPEELGGLIEELDAHRGTVSRANTVLGITNNVWRVAMEEWHAVSVLVTAIGRVSFKGSPHAHLWQRVRATGQGRECILQEGRAIEYAWESSDPAWWPKPGVTLASYQALRAVAEEAAEGFAMAQNAASVARSLWHEKVNALHELCVNWYAVARATFPDNTTEGQLVRQVAVGSRRRRTPSEQPAPTEAVAA